MSENLKSKEVYWYQTPAGKPIVKETVSDLSKEDRSIIGEDIWLIQMRFPKGAPVLKALGNGLYEVRSTISGKREFRCIIVYDADEDALLVVHAFVKKTQKTPLSDLNLAKTRAKEALTRAFLVSFESKTVEKML